MNSNVPKRSNNAFRPRRRGGLLRPRTGFPAGRLARGAALAVMPAHRRAACISQLSLHFFSAARKQFIPSVLCKVSQVV